MKKIYKFSVVLILFLLGFQTMQGAIVYGLDNACGTAQLVVYVTPDQNYTGGQAVWSPAVFTITWPMGLGSGLLGAISNQNGFAFSTAGALGNDGTHYYQKFAHTGSPTLAMTNGFNYEVAKIALIGSVGIFGSLSIEASTNQWIIDNNGFSVMSNPDGNQVVQPYSQVTSGSIPLFPGIIWDGISWCGGSGDGEQPGTTDASKNCYVYGSGGILTTWNANVNQLFIDAIGQMTIQPAASLTAASTVTINSNEGLVIAAGPTGTGSFINSISPIVYGVDGSAKVQAYMKNVASPGTFHTHLIGPLVKDPLNPGGVSGVYLGAFNLQVSGTYSYRYDEPSNLWVNVYQPTDPIPTASGLALSDVSSTSKTLSMTGQLATPNVATTTLSPWNPTIGGTGNGLHLFSNPFPCGLDLDQFFGSNSGAARFSTNNTFYIWNDESSNYETWVADDLFGGSGTGNLNAANGRINPGQGFFGQRAGTQVIGYIATHRVHIHTPFLKNSEPYFLRIRASGNFSSDELIIRFKENATSGFDLKKDALKWASMQDFATQISTVTPEPIFLSVNTLPLLSSGQMTSVPMNFSCGADDVYAITASNVESFDLGTEIWLEDLFLGGEWHSLVQNPLYEFTASPEDPENRFIVHFFSTTGIDDPVAQSAIRIYGYGQDAYIVNRGTETVKEYIAYDMMGRELHRGTLPNSTVNKVFIGNVNAYYIVKVMTKEGNVYTDKVYISQ